MAKLFVYYENADGHGLQQCNSFEDWYNDWIEGTTYEDDPMKCVKENQMIFIVGELTQVVPRKIIYKLDKGLN